MKGRLILDRTVSRPDGKEVFVFEHTDSAGEIRFLNFPADRIPTSLKDSLRQGDILTAEWTEDRILTGEIRREETEAAAKEANDLLQKLFAKGKK